MVQGKAAYDLLMEQGCEGAGGPVVSNPAKDAAFGGCEQNSDYVANGNKTYRDVCPGSAAAPSSKPFIVSSRTAVVLVSTIVLLTLSLLY